jgi:hypothetical protein
VSSSVDITQSKVLVVEGKDEVNFFVALIRFLNLSSIQVLNIEGKHKFKNKLKAVSITSGFSNVASLGIVLDADDNPSGTFQSVCSALKYSNLPIPNNPLESYGQNPKVSVMILPEPNATGMLEDVCLKSIESDIAMDCVNDFFNCLDDKDIKPKNASKAKVQVFLASKPETGIPLGIAAQKGYWPFKNAVFNQLKDFLHNV